MLGWVSLTVASRTSSDLEGWVGWKLGKLRGILVVDILGQTILGVSSFGVGELLRTTFLRRIAILLLL